MSFFRHKSGENELCSRPVSVSATHSRKIWEPMIPTLFHNGHKRTFKWSYRWNHELKVQTYIKQISCDAKSICFNPFTRRYNTSRRGGGMVVPDCLHWRRESTHLGDGKCVNQFNNEQAPKLHSSRGSLTALTQHKCPSSFMFTEKTC